MKVWLQMNFRKSVHACSIAFGFVVGLSFPWSAATADELVSVSSMYVAACSIFQVFSKSL
jgi:hypothetical protein